VESELKMFALNDAALAHVRKGEYALARSTYEEAIQLKPEPGDVVSSKARRWVQTNLAWLLSTCPDGAVRDGSRGVTLAEEVVASTPKDIAYLDTLAAAYAEAGRFEEAVKTQQAALAPMTKGNPLRDEYRDHLKSYKDGKPWRDSGLKK
jgi:cytochrome c-type biogenesis protein CcmH/NrfG